MLLRSSSTPILGSLLYSLSETPTNNFNHYEASPTTLHHSHSYSKLPFCQTGSLTASCNSSPVISPSINGERGFQRAKSEDNLEGQSYASHGNSTEDQFCETIQPKMFPKRPKCLMLQTIPSFSFYSSRGGVENEEEYDSDIEDFDEDGEEWDYENEKFSQRKARGGDIGMSMETAYFCLEGKAKNMSFTGEARVRDEYSNVGVEERNELEIQRMYLSKLLGIGCNGGRGGNGGGGGGGGGDSNSPGSGSGGDDGDKQGVEEYYKKMVEENPGDPLFLRNYAQFLYQSKGDLRAAEEFYSRAILADPKDGDILSQYAKLVWELHHDLDRAASYFERAVSASPLDNFVQAAYANFLWDTEEDGEDDLSDAMKDLHLKPPHLHGRAIASAAAKKLCYGRSR